MFRHFFTVFIRHLIKNKFNNLLNFCGLAFAFALVYVIGTAAADAIFSDTWLKDSDRIYRINWVDNGTRATPTTFGPVGPLIDANMEDVAATSRLVKHSVTAYRDSEGFAVKAAYADAGFAEIFALPMVEGSLAETLVTPRGIALSAHEAQRLFGHQQAIGQTLPIALGTSVHDYTVTAIFQNIPQASHLSLSALMPLISSDFAAIKKSYVLDSFSNSGSVATYIALRKGVDKTTFQDRFFSELKSLLPRDVTRNSPDVYTAENIVGLQFWSSTERGHMKDPVNAIAVTGSAVMALLVLIAAISNHINLTIAATLRRGREVAMRLVLGGSKSQIIRQLFFETLIVMAAAGLLSVDIAYYLHGATGGFLGQESVATSAVRGTENALLALLVLAASLLTALYPSLWLSRLKSSNLLATSGRGLTGGANRTRAVLVAVQVALGAALIFATLTIYRQVDFLTSINKGFDDDSLVHINLSHSKTGNANRAAFMAEVRKLPGIENVTLASVIPYIPSNSRTGFSHPRTQEQVEYETVWADPAFFDTYGIKPLAGRLLSPYFGADSDATLLPSPPTGGRRIYEQNIIVSEALVQQHDFASNEAAIGGLFRRWTTTDAGGKRAFLRQIIVGVVPDIAFKAGKSTQAATFYENSAWGFGYLTANSPKQKASVTKDQIESIWKDFFPNDPFSFSYPAQNLANAYQQESQMLEVFTIAGAVCLLISVAGLSGLARFVALQRRREFAIRRVVGATQRELLRLAVVQFGKPVLVGLFIGVPAAHYALADWLNQYQSRIEPSLLQGLFFTALAAVFALAIVLYEVWRGTQFRPADILGHE